MNGEYLTEDGTAYTSIYHFNVYLTVTAIHGNEMDGTFSANADGNSLIGNLRDTVANGAFRNMPIVRQND